MSIAVGTYSGTNIPAGDHQFPFKFHLPDFVPSSFTGGFGLIRFWAQAFLDQYPNGSNITREKELIVHGLYDLNSVPSTLLPFEETKTDTNCCLCCESGNYSYTVNLPKTGYTRGEKIMPAFELRNGTPSRCSLTVKIKQEVKYESGKNTTKEVEILNTVTTFVAPNTVERWCPSIELSHLLPPSKLLHCDNISFNYRMKYEYMVEGCNVDSISNSINLVLGNLPDTGPLPVITQPVAQASDVAVFVYTPADFTGNPESGPMSTGPIASKEYYAGIGYGGAQEPPAPPALPSAPPSVPGQYPAPPGSHQDKPPPPSYTECMDTPSITGGYTGGPLAPASAPSPSSYVQPSYQGYSYQVQDEEKKKLS